MLTDVGHLVTCLRSIRGLRDKGKTLDRWVRDRYVYTMSRARRTSTFSSASLKPAAAAPAAATEPLVEDAARREESVEEGRAAAAPDAAPAPAPVEAAPLKDAAGVTAGVEVSGVEAHVASKVRAAPKMGEAKGAVEKPAEDTVE